MTNTIQPLSCPALFPLDRDNQLNKGPSSKEKNPAIDQLQLIKNQPDKNPDGRCRPVHSFELAVPAHGQRVCNQSF